MIKDNILEVKGRIACACQRVGRNPEEISVVAVSKGRGVEQIQEAIAAGITDIGENKIQEALMHASGYRLQASGYKIQNSKITTHMVGHLQTNKAKGAVKIFDLIHSVDSLHLTEEINKQAAKINKIQDILIEVKTSLEETKFGVEPDDLFGLIGEISKFKNIRLRGLMTIASLGDNPEQARPYFRLLRELRDKINNLQPAAPCLPGRQGSLQLLSMGMTDDFEVAIEEGANMVRLGRAIFENTD